MGSDQDKQQLEVTLRELRRSSIMHVDMDAFFVLVELRSRPELRGKPVIVGYPADRSVVLSASYEARKFGVKSAMPMVIAARMCPSAVIIEPRHKLYYEVSAQLMDIFGSITDLVEPLSVDEAFLDVGGAIRRLGSPRVIGGIIRRRVHEELGITASVGIAASKFVAKIASTRCKPDGLLLIEPDQTVPYLHSLPVNALWGVGAKTGEVLARMGIRTVADVAATPLASLKKSLGAAGEHVYRLSWGIDPRPVTPVRLEKSIGAEETFAEDTGDNALLHRELLRLSHRTAERLRSTGMMARTISLKLRYADFSTITRSRTVHTPVDSAQLIYAVVLQLFESLGPRTMTVRLVGVRAEQLENAAQTSLQLSLDRRDDNWRAAEQALDRVSRKFGSKSVLPARLLDPHNPSHGPSADRSADGPPPS